MAPEKIQIRHVQSSVPRFPRRKPRGSDLSTAQQHRACLFLHGIMSAAGFLRGMVGSASALVWVCQFVRLWPLLRGQWASPSSCWAFASMPPAGGWCGLGEFRGLGPQGAVLSISCFAGGVRVAAHAGLSQKGRPKMHSVFFVGFQGGHPQRDTPVLLWLYGEGYPEKEAGHGGGAGEHQILL